MQYISIWATYFGIFTKTIFRPVLTIGRYIQCAHTLWDPIVFTYNHNNHEGFLLRMQV